MLNIKPPYIVAAMATERISSQDEMQLAHAVDEFVQQLRMQELIFPELDLQARSQVISKHVDAAYEYYSHFSAEDMAKMLLVNSLIKETTENAEEETK